MITRLVRTIQVVVLRCGGSRALVLENLALRQQLGMHQRSRPKPAVRRTDRWFWVGLCRLWVANARRATTRELRPPEPDSPNGRSQPPVGCTAHPR